MNILTKLILSLNIMRMLGGGNVPSTEWQDSQSRLDSETEQSENLVLVSFAFANLTPVSSCSRLASILRSSLVSVSILP